MNARRFRQLLGRRSPGIELWPRDDREAARALLAKSSRARRLYRAALDTDETLDSPIDSALLDRLVAGARARIVAEPRRVRPWPGRIIAPLQWGALAACALLGIWAGTPGKGLSAAPPSAVLASFQMTALDPPWTEDAP